MAVTLGGSIRIGGSKLEKIAVIRIVSVHC